MVEMPPMLETLNMRFEDKRYLNQGDVGKIRTVIKFLLFPLKIGKETRWLEKCTYEEIVEPHSHELKTYHWVPRRFNN